MCSFGPRWPSFIGEAWSRKVTRLSPRSESKQSPPRAGATEQSKVTTPDGQVEGASTPTHQVAPRVHRYDRMASVFSYPKSRIKSSKGSAGIGHWVVSGRALHVACQRRAAGHKPAGVLPRSLPFRHRGMRAGWRRADERRWSSSAPKSAGRLPRVGHRTAGALPCGRSRHLVGHAARKATLHVPGCVGTMPLPPTSGDQEHADDPSAAVRGWQRNNRAA